MLAAYDAILDAPPCRLGARFTGDALTRLDFLPTDLAPSHRLDSRARHLAAELDAYWRDSTHRFDLLYTQLGTAFQLRVWHALTRIPAGQPVTYGALAQQLGTAPRAVGQACGANPIPIIIPCHRVVATGGLGGFMHAASGAPLDIKQWLLQHERVRPASQAWPRLPYPREAAPSTWPKPATKH
jgi:methylated-DNA-[protein]-cysteine S-methyltransferase